MSTQAVAKQAGRAAWGHAVIEVGSWLIALSTAALCYCLGGTTGLGSLLGRDVLAQVWKRQGEGQFESTTAVWWLLILLALICLGFMLPGRLLRDMLPTPRATFVASIGVLVGVLGIVFSFVRVAWLGWIIGLFLGALVASAAFHVPQLHRKPWRTAGASAGIALFVLFVAQLLEGPGAAARTLPWLALAGGVTLIAASAFVYVSGTPRTADLPEPTDVISRRITPRGVRAPQHVAVPWACHVLIAILAGTFVLALPAVTENGFGMAGFALVLCGVLVGWAAGYEVGPTFAPGMTRPRLTSFALLGAGIMELGAGLLTELSGIAVFSSLVAFCVGVGLRSQVYDVHRRYGFAVGGAVALALAGVLPPASIHFNADFVWHVAPSMNAHLIFGAIGIVAAIVALFLFCPQGVAGLSVDVVHAFTPVPPPESGEQGVQAGRDKDEAHDGQAAQEAATTVLKPNPPAAPTPADEDATVAMPAGAKAADRGSDTSAGSDTNADGAAVGLRIPAVRRPSAGAFITFEGIDGSGKTTQLRLLAQHLKDRGLTDVVSTREPGGTPAGKQIRHVVQGGKPVAPRSEALLFAADRAHHIASLVEPALERGAVVLGDRYIDSSVAYQAAGRQLSSDDIRAISRWATTGLVPQLTVLIDTDLRAAGQRTEGRGEENHLDQENQDFKGRVRSTFLALAAANPDRYVVIDGTRDIDQVAADVAAAVDPVVATLIPDYESAPAGDGEADERLESAIDQAGDADADLEYTDVCDEVTDDESGIGVSEEAPAASDDGDMPEFLRERASKVETNPILDRDEPLEPVDSAAEEGTAEGSAPDDDGATDSGADEDAVTHVLGRPRRPAAEQPGEDVPPASSEPPAQVEPPAAPTTPPPPAEPTPAEPASGEQASEQRHQQELDRLRAQADIERRARERLREARLRQQRGEK